MGYGKERRPVYSRASDRKFPITVSSAVSTNLAPRGLVVFKTSATSSESPPVWTLQAPKAGDVLEVVAHTIVSSSVSPIHVNSGTAVFCYTTGSTGQDMMTLSTQGAGARMIAISSCEWMVTAIRAATFSTST